ncbi:MAG: SAM hydrolase/SAM-dependent halogenase family protein [Desulfovibrionaceae bacterium]
MSRSIALLTDFGLKDPYVGQMKAVLAGHAKTHHILDICHEIEPFNVIQAGFYLAVSYPYFPEGSIFVAVVDPGVGTPRRIVLAERSNRIFLAPDNGLLSMVLDGASSLKVWDVSRAAVDIQASATFHGRDIFAPLAARLASGVRPQELGREVDVSSLRIEPWKSPRSQDDGVEADVLHVDRFGNCILNLRTGEWLERLTQWTEPGLVILNRFPVKVIGTYGELEENHVGLLAGSQGFLELAMNRRSAAKNLSLKIGSSVMLTDFAAG